MVTEPVVRGNPKELFVKPSVFRGAKWAQYVADSNITYWFKKVKGSDSSFRIRYDKVI